MVFRKIPQISAYRSSHRTIKKVLKSGNFFKKETLVQVFFCEFCEIFMNTFFAKRLRATASVPSFCFPVDFPEKEHLLERGAYNIF